MTDISALLSELRRQNVYLWIEGAKLRCRAPAGAMNAGLRLMLSSRKDELMACLRQAEAVKSAPPSIVPFNLEGSRRPVFFLSGDRDNIFYTRPLARYLGPDRPVLVVQPPGYGGEAPLDSMEALARYQVEQMRLYQPEGPYLVAGHCMGGPIAFEAARLLREVGQSVAFLALIASRFPSPTWPEPSAVCKVMKHLDALRTRSASERLKYVVGRLRAAAENPNVAEVAGRSALASANEKVLERSFVALRGYAPRRYDGPVDLFFTSYDWFDFRKWRTVAGTLKRHEFGFDVHELRVDRHVREVARALENCLHEAEAAGDSGEAA